MNIGILYFKKDNRIQDFFSNVKAVYPSKVEYENGGCVEGFAVNGVSVIVVENLNIEYVEETEKSYLIDLNGNKYNYGDVLPDGLIDISEQFKKPTIEELQKRSLILTEENAELIIQNATQEVAINALQSENAELLVKIATLEVNLNV